VFGLAVLQKQLELEASPLGKLAKAARKLAAMYERDEGPMPLRCMAFDHGAPVCAFGHVLDLAGARQKFAGLNYVGSNCDALSVYLDGVRDHYFHTELLLALGEITEANDNTGDNYRRRYVVSPLRAFADMAEACAFTIGKPK
jgi:hypothetical protein